MALITLKSSDDDVISAYTRGGLPLPPGNKWSTTAIKFARKLLVYVVQPSSDGGTNVEDPKRKSW